MMAEGAGSLQPSASRQSPGYAYGSITDKISDIVLSRPSGVRFWTALAVTGAFSVLFVVAICYLFATGVGIWGVNQPVAWAFALTNFVWWVGIGHAGTFISAILLLVRQKWRTSINRFAEAMTIFAIVMAGLMPILHLGRPWFFYWLVPYPNIMNLWPQWRSPLVWDIFAISTYIIVSILFWYMGLLPDLATLRDRAGKHWQRVAYGLAALGWRGDARHWHRYDSAYLLMAGLATPLVISVHSVVSLDFSIAGVPGWHSTIFPPYFVAGALFSGFAMALTLAIPLRHVFRLHEFITARHLDNMAKLMLACGLVVAYSYLVEVWTAFYSGDRFEIFTTRNRAFGPEAWLYWCVLAFNVVIPQALWWRRVRHSPIVLFLIAIVINAGMWMERFMIIVVSLQRDFLPSSWGHFVPTFWDWATLAGSLGTFALLFLLFVRFLPAISMSEMRKLEKQSGAAR
ncbi:MAG: NrfD/PsrC family molybdoenzyme membrane anchor subunit [Steroidobacteraceae bacterium]